jgi:hypothetical protein
MWRLATEAKARSVVALAWTITASLSLTCLKDELLCWCTQMACSLSARAHLEAVTSVETGRNSGLTCQMLLFTCEPVQLYERWWVLVSPGADVASRGYLLPSDAGVVWLSLTSHGLAIH